MRLIKKYSNRRLYDTSNSTYITLADVKQLVLQYIPFEIRDAKTNEDLTHIVLLQIISEAEHASTPMFTTELLLNIIRFYGNSMQGMMSQYLEKGLQTFIEQQRKGAEEGASYFMSANPLNAMAEFSKQQLSLWQTAMDAIIKKQTPTATKEKK
ncbi:hypothetical protein BH10PSE19_BH10PSE19_17880 [soil metagenome]